MKRNIVLLLSLFFATMGIAQPPNPPKPPTPEVRLKHFAEKLDKEMSLTNEQKQKVLAEYKAFFSKMDQLHDKFPPPPPPPPPSGMKEEMEKVIASRDEKLKKILTEAQFSKLKEMEKKRMKDGRDGMPPPPPVE